jgi:molecular chaperone GrpE (heat shock protein)
MLTKTNILTITAAIGTFALLYGVFWFWHRRVRHQLRTENTSDRKQEAKHLSEVDTTSPESHPYTINPNSFGKETLHELALKIQDPNLRDYLLEIANTVTEVGQVFNAETPLSFVEEMVDRLDDLRAIQTNHQEPTRSLIDFFRKILIGILSECDTEVIHSTHWDPSQQRAIAKEPTSGIEVPAILRHGSSGIRRNGQLLRKQEVVLAVSITSLKKT